MACNYAIKCYNTSAIALNLPMPKDQNFDHLAHHFIKKVSASYKGEIRRAVISADLTDFDFDGKRVWDIGTGDGQMAHFCANKGALVDACDISAQMLALATPHANIRYHHCRYQDFNSLGATYDLALVHGVLEWLQDGEALFARLKDTRTLSLCFYNPDGLLYRNLIMGNFFATEQPLRRQGRTLTPTHPRPIAWVQTMLDKYGFSIMHASGVRVFYDYAHKQGGNLDMQAVVQKEIAMARRFWQMGRYVHFLARKM